MNLYPYAKYVAKLTKYRKKSFEHIRTYADIRTNLGSNIV